MIDQFVLTAISILGASEEGGNNNGQAIREIQKATWLQGGKWAWCAAFCCWVMEKWLQSDAEYLVSMNITDIEAWRCKNAAAFGWIKWGKDRKLKVFEFADGIPNILIKAGDLVIYTYSHIGIAAEDQKTQRAAINVIEGNTNDAGERDSEKGDRVMIKSRPCKQIKAIVRLEKA